MKRQTQSGNVLFLILIAVALFAALSYAVMGSTRSGEQSTQKEDLDLATNVITSYGDGLTYAIAKLQAIEGCSDVDISFVYDSNGSGAIDSGDDYYNQVSNASGNDRCNVFDNAPRQNPPKEATEDTYYFTHACVVGIGLGTNGICWAADDTDDSDLIMILGVTETHCEFINDRSHINAVNRAPVGKNYAAGTSSAFAEVRRSAPFIGTYTLGNSFSGTSNHHIKAQDYSPSDYFGKTFGCIEVTHPTIDIENPSFLYYQVLLER